MADDRELDNYILVKEVLVGRVQYRTKTSIYNIYNSFNPRFFWFLMYVDLVTTFTCTSFAACATLHLYFFFAILRLRVVNNA